MRNQAAVIAVAAAVMALGAVAAGPMPAVKAADDEPWRGQRRRKSSSGKNRKRLDEAMRTGKLPPKEQPAA